MRNDSEDFENLVRFIYDDEEVKASGATSYQIACILAATFQYLVKEKEEQIFSKELLSRPMPDGIFKTFSGKDGTL